MSALPLLAMLVVTERLEAVGSADDVVSSAWSWRALSTASYQSPLRNSGDPELKRTQRTGRPAPVNGNGVLHNRTTALPYSHAKLAKVFDIASQAEITILVSR
jgi:hypothetical protein